MGLAEEIEKIIHEVEEMKENHKGDVKRVDIYNQVVSSLKAAYIDAIIEEVTDNE